MLAVTIGRYRQQFEQRRGPLWDFFRDRAPAAFDAGRPTDRERGLRSDGADSLLCVIVSILSCMDLRRGFLGRPPADGPGKWHRRSVRELFGFAFGASVPGALSQRRLERHLRSLRALGMIQTHQMRSRTARGFESVTAIRHVTDELFRLAGTAAQLAKERREAFERAAGERRARRIESVRLDSPRPAPPGPPDVSGRGAPSRGAPSRAGPSTAADLLGHIIAPLRP